MRFERGGNMMEKMDVGVKKDLHKVSSIEVRLGRGVEYHDSGNIYKSQPINQIKITGKKSGMKVVRKLNKLTERAKLKYNNRDKALRGVSRLTIQNIFNFSAGELQYTDYIRIFYKVEKKDEFQKFGTMVGGGKALWKPTDEIFEVEVKEIYLMENDFWFKILGMDYD